jgi:hypothetical protein
MFSSLGMLLVALLLEPHSWQHSRASRRAVPSPRTIRTPATSDSRVNEQQPICDILIKWTNAGIKGSQVHIAPAYTGPEKGYDHFGSYVRNISLHFCKWLFPRFEPFTSWSQATVLPLYHCLGWRTNAGIMTKKFWSQGNMGPICLVINRTNSMNHNK